MVYSSIENDKVKDIKKLQQKKYRDKSGMFLIEGEHLVLEAYKSGYLKKLILEENDIFPIDIDIMYVTNNVLNYISELETAPRMIGICEKNKELESIGKRILVLDNIQDPGNLGTMIRSAVAFHIDTIILGDGTVDLYNSKVIRASQGMLFHINIIRKDLIIFLEELQKNNYQILGTKVTYGKNLKSLEKNEKFAIIMGNEGNGLSDEVSNFCNDFIYIDMDAVCESLNVAVATSIILYEMDK